MRTSKLTRPALSARNRIACLLVAGAAILSISYGPYARGGDPDLKVLKLGLGSGTVTSDSAHPGIDCGLDCDQGYASTDTVVLTAVPDGESTFDGWQGLPFCTGTAPCSVPMSEARAVRAVFTLNAPINPLSESDLTPEGIQTYLGNVANRHVNTPARFIAALPEKFRQNWILMSRSESLQTGTAYSPRILLPSFDARNVFTVGMTELSSYPGSHHNAVEYMQWDAAQKNFRFHEVVLFAIPPMGDIPAGSTTPRFDARPRGIVKDDAKCSKCHSTRNVLNLRDRSVTPPLPGRYPATDGVPPGSVQAKNKPNWDAYDSWGGMMPFNRDRIYQGSVEAAAFRHIFNLWNWRGTAEKDSIRQIIEQLVLQPPHVPATSPHSVTRNYDSTTDDAHIRFGFDTLPPLPPTTPLSVGYSFDRPSVMPTPVERGGRYVTLRHSDPDPVPFNDDYNNPITDEGRGVQLFDLLGGLDGTLNAERIADELVNHQYATGNVPVDVRPIAMAISKGTCLRIDTTTNTVVSNPTALPALPALTVPAAFFDARNGMNVTQVRADTMTRWAAASGSTPEVAATRSTDFPRRKVDAQKFNFDRTGDPYMFAPRDALEDAVDDGLIQQYGDGTTAGTDASVNRLRQEIFRRPIDLGGGDATAMGGAYVDREEYGYNTDRVALYRYFLEPLGVSVDKWSMGVRGRSRSYTFADVFSTYANVFEPALGASMLSAARRVPEVTNPNDCGQLINAINRTLSASALPAAGDVPRYTDVQRIFNKSCIECHGALGYPPYGVGGVDLSEQENLPDGLATMPSPRMARSHAFASGSADYILLLMRRTSEDCRPGVGGSIGLMPCGGPALSKVDIETFARWAGGARANTAGDPHIKTVNGVNYDFQSAGEFVLLRGENLEVQARQTAVSTDAPLGPNRHTGLASCVSVNTAAAVRVGEHRITYQPNLSGRPDPSGLELRVDGKPARVGERELLLPSGARILRTTAPGGIRVEAPGGTSVIITPGWWEHYQLWYLNIDTDRARATEGVMGTVGPGEWLPALPDGSFMGPMPRDLHQRYLDLYEKFENAWRVSDATSLFDYAPGTSTASFTFENWPEESPQRCVAPPEQVSGPAHKPPAKALPLEVAQQHCREVVAEDRKANCVLDVMATGEPGFAETYLLTERIERHAPPAAPALVSPEDNKTDLAKPVTFTWNGTTGANGDPVTYRHCVWVSGDAVTFKDCDAEPVRTSWWRGGARHAAWVALVGLLLLLILFFLGLKRRPALLSLLVLLILAGVVLAFYVGRPGLGPMTVTRALAPREPGKAYLWKVIAEDGKGGTTESETRRFVLR